MRINGVPARPSATSPNPAVVAPPSQTFQRGIEGSLPQPYTLLGKLTRWWFGLRAPLPSPGEYGKFQRGLRFEEVQELARWTYHHSRCSRHPCDCGLDEAWTSLKARTLGEE